MTDTSEATSHAVVCDVCKKDTTVDVHTLEPFNPYSTDDGWIWWCPSCGVPNQLKGVQDELLQRMVNRNNRIASAKYANMAHYNTTLNSSGFSNYTDNAVFYGDD